MNVQVAASVRAEVYFEVHGKVRPIRARANERAGGVMDLVLVIERVAEPLHPVARIDRSCGCSNEDEGALQRAGIPLVPRFIDRDVGHAVFHSEGQKAARDDATVRTSDRRHNEWWKGRVMEMDRAGCRAISIRDWRTRAGGARWNRKGYEKSEQRTEGDRGKKLPHRSLLWVLHYSDTATVARSQTKDKLSSHPSVNCRQWIAGRPGSPSFGEIRTSAAKVGRRPKAPSAAVADDPLLDWSVRRAVIRTMGGGVNPSGQARKDRYSTMRQQACHPSSPYPRG